MTVLVRRLSHEAAGDLRLVLTRAGDTANAAIILDQQCASFNFGALPPVDLDSPGTDYSFSHDAEVSLATSCAPVIPEGLYQPSGSMGGLLGQPANGAWQLSVQDIASVGAQSPHCLHASCCAAR